jgi:hypothetical protein
MIIITQAVLDASPVIFFYLLGCSLENIHKVIKRLDQDAAWIRSIPPYGDQGLTG